VTVNSSSETATAKQPSDESPETDVEVDRPSDHRLLIGGTAVGYLVAVIATVAVPVLFWQGLRYLWIQQAVDISRIGWLSEPSFIWITIIGSVSVIIVLSVACLDLLVLRGLMGESQLNHSGLFVWIGGSILGVIGIPSVVFLHPLGLLLFVPAVIGLVVGGGIVNMFIPHALFEGEALRTAGRQSSEAFVDSPTVVVAPVSALLAGWVVGTGFFIAGVVVIWFSLAFWVLVLTFPIPLLLWICSAFVFAVVHVQYRLWTLATYSQ
jgi:hypothetical protein